MKATIINTITKATIGSPVFFSLFSVVLVLFFLTGLSSFLTILCSLLDVVVGAFETSTV